MKRMIIVLATIFVTFSNCFAISTVSKGDEIPIPLESYVNEVDTIIIRTPTVPVAATLIPTQSIISVTFMYNMGEVSVEISNLFTGEEYYYEESSFSGSAILPFTGSAGYYIIRFRTETGVCCYGYFSIE